jgi:hypothetical protein
MLLLMYMEGNTADGKDATEPEPRTITGVTPDIEYNMHIVYQ